MTSPLPFFSDLTDSRVERTKVHMLEDILFITIASVICGAESWNDMEDFGKVKKELESSFLSWSRSVAKPVNNEVVSIDGKSMNDTREYGSKSTMYMISAWTSKNHIELGQLKVDEKSNEITAIPKLLDSLVITGCIVTIDAMGCPKDIVSVIAGKEADYLIAVKRNQGNLQKQMEDSFHFLPTVSVSENTDCNGHGRVKTRRCSVISDLSLIGNREEWKNLHSLIKIETERYNKCRQTTLKETRLYISSLKADADLINRFVRSHWGVRNSLHWVLNVAFNEEHSKKIAGNAAQNFPLINRIALNLLKNEKAAKVGVREKGSKLDGTMVIC